VRIGAPHANPRVIENLRAGYPIASGAVEGACRHLAKDRMERAGMHWTIRGAQAMLDVRSIDVSQMLPAKVRGNWETNRTHANAATMQPLET